MKSVLKVCNISTSKDVVNIKTIIANNQGVIACQIHTSNGEVEVIYDDYFTTENKIIDSLESAGYTVL